MQSQTTNINGLVEVDLILRDTKPTLEFLYLLRNIILLKQLRPVLFG